VQITFYAGEELLFRFKDQVSVVTKKDFVPYSERKEAERKMLQERSSRDTDSADASEEKIQQRMREFSSKELNDILPL
jgi:hypothetical protein